MSMGETLASIASENDSFSGVRRQAVHSFHAFLTSVLDAIVGNSRKGSIISGTIEEFQEGIISF